MKHKLRHMSMFDLAKSIEIMESTKYANIDNWNKYKQFVIEYNNRLYELQ